MRALEDRKDLRIGSKLKTFLLEAGLEEVDSNMIPLPLSAWSTGEWLPRCFTQGQNLTQSVDRRMRAIGQCNSDNIQQLLRSLSLYPLTQRLHMSTENFESLVQQAQEEAMNHSLKAYFPL